MIPTDTPQYRLAHHIAREVGQMNGRAILVGGCVRDAMLSIVPKDLDIELFGIVEDCVESILARCGNVLRVGRAFPVWKVWTDEMGQGEAVDVALPRYETKRGEGHTDFTVTLDPFMTFAEAAWRRDFTMNAMGYDPLTSELLDPHGGKHDLRAGVLRHVSAHFAEDPLRVMRGAQFCARFNLSADPETIAVCWTLTPEHISTERLWEEWQKLILKGKNISHGLSFLRKTGWIEDFPELDALVDVPQDSQHHPEGPVHLHLDHCMDAFAATRTGNDREDLIVGLAVLLHDTGKASCTTFGEDGKWHAYGHEEAGEAPARSFLGRLTNDAELIESVVALVTHHMIPTFLYQEATRGGTLKAMNRSLRRLAREVRLDLLARVVYCDKAGRPPKPQVSPESDWIRERAAAIEVLNSKPKPILMGRHLIELGLTPGLAFKQILSGAFEQQLDGEISTLEEAIAYARVCLRPPTSPDTIYPR